MKKIILFAALASVTLAATPAFAAGCLAWKRTSHGMKCVIPMPRPVSNGSIR